MGPALAAALVLVLVLAAWAQDKVQPIQFPHKKHVGQGLACVFCHRYVEQLPAASIPGVKVCITCHQNPITKSREEEKIREYAKAGRDIPWVRLYVAGDDIYFSHRRHVALGQVACEKCHGKMGETLTPPLKPLVKITMDGCLSCHKQVKASTDCVACHR